MEFGVEKIWGDWKTVRLLGEGSFGKVYEIVREQFGLQERSAVKIISIPSSPSEVQSLKSDGMTEANITEYYEGIVTEFVQEIMMMSKLRGHTNIVGYEDYKVVKRTDSFGWDIYIRMELLTSLTAYMEAMQGADPDATVSVNGREANVFGETDVIKMAVDICSALEVCYAQHIVHRDIKPDNIFVSADGNFKLGDFGVAKTVEKTVSGLSKKGTPTYMAPEIYKGEPGGMNSDIYSLGIVMYKLLNDNREPFLPPFPETVRYEHKQQALARRMNGESVPRTKQGSDMLWEIVERACESDAKKRWQNPTALKNALLSVRKSGDVKRTAPKPVPPKPVPPPVPKPDPDATVAVRKAEETKTTAVKRPSPAVVEKTGSSVHTPSVSTKKATTKKKMSLGKKVAIALIVWLTVALAIGIVSAVWLRPMMEGSPTEQTKVQITADEANEQGYTEEDIKNNPALASVGTVTSVTPTHYAEITIQDRGTIKVALDEKNAPITVANFKKLADEGFYNGLTFHRIMEGFIMQGGDPAGNGTGGSDEEIKGEFAENGVENPLSHVRGAISMSRTTDPNSASSQFFIVHEDSTFLDGQYAAFGYVVEGMDIVDAICTEAKPVDDNGTIPAAEQPIITAITVYEA